MKILTKTFKTLKLAEQYQNRLYAKYDCVRLIGFPRFAEGGIYTWEVA